MLFSFNDEQCCFSLFYMCAQEKDFSANSFLAVDQL